MDWVQIKLHTENQLPMLPGMILKVKAEVRWSPNMGKAMLGYYNFLLLTVDQLSLLRRSFLEAENVSLVKCVSLEINCDQSLIFVIIFKIPQSLESRSSSRPVLLFQQMDRTHTFHPHQWTGYIFAAEKENIIQGLFFIFLWGRVG